MNRIKEFRLQCVDMLELNEDKLELKTDSGYNNDVKVREGIAV